MESNRAEQCNSTMRSATLIRGLTLTRLPSFSRQLHTLAATHAVNATTTTSLRPAVCVSFAEAATHATQTMESSGADVAVKHESSFLTTEHSTCLAPRSLLYLPSISIMHMCRSMRVLRDQRLASGSHMSRRIVPTLLMRRDAAQQAISCIRHAATD